MPEIAIAHTTTRRASLALVGASAAAVVLPAAAEPASALPDLFRQMVEADHGSGLLVSRIERIEHSLARRGIEVPPAWPTVRVGPYRCWSEEEIADHLAAGRCQAAEAERAAGLLHRRVAEADRVRGEHGLTPLDQERQRLEAEYHRLRSTIAETPATTLDDVAAKLRAALHVMDDGTDGQLVRTALDGLVQLTGRA